MPLLRRSRRVRATFLIVGMLLLGGALWRNASDRDPAAPSFPRPATTVATNDPEVTGATPVEPVAAPTPAPPEPRGEVRRAAQSPALFSYVRETPPEAFLPTSLMHVVRLDRALIEGKTSPFWHTGDAGRLSVPLPDGRSVPVMITATDTLGARRFVSQGTIEGLPLGRALFAYNDGVLSAVIEEPGLGNWQLTQLGGETRFYLVDDRKIPECAGERKALVDTDAIQEMARRATLPVGPGAAGVEPLTPVAPVPAGLAAIEAAPRSEIRVLVVYTSAVLAAGRTVASVQADIDVGLALVNSNLANSKVPAVVTLAAAALVDYPELAAPASGSDRLQDDALTRLRLTRDGFLDDVHTLRDQVAADLVTLLLQRAEAGTDPSAGIAYLLDTPGLTTNSQINAFSVIGYAFLNTAVFSHELGHNLGCSHNREDSGTLGTGRTYHGAYPSSYGYRFTGADGRGYRTIMAYDEGGRYQRVPYFSNPAVTAPAPVNAPVGAAESSPGQAYNALTIELNAFEVANFRLTPDSPVNLGRLVAISTRAFVGAGDQQLIGGFAINPGAAKEVLVRAAGPALAQLNVTGSLPDPQMTLFRLESTGATTVTGGANDDWGSQTGGQNAATLSAAMNAVGAFPFGAGGKDAAVLMTLPPGNYTANITGGGGTTGVALMEVYERSRTTANKLIDISTRAYIGPGKEMIAGFVVGETAGQTGRTKRILIRVLGPTLARLGVTGAAEDPQVALYDDAGHLLTTNDDWSSGTIGGDAFRPNTTTTYGEREIFNTGYAPANKRDSALLVDLKPGAYTAIVTPFEKLPDQPARPGIALVEVYEIDP